MYRCPVPNAVMGKSVVMCVPSSLCSSVSTRLLARELRQSGSYQIVGIDVEHATLEGRRRLGCRPIAEAAGRIDTTRKCRDARGSVDVPIEEGSQRRTRSIPALRLFTTSTIG
jgi:hypothetical protein